MPVLRLVGIIRDGLHDDLPTSVGGIVAELLPEDILVSQIPLLAESEHPYAFDFVVTVSASEETRRARLIQRGMKDYQVTMRMKAQATDAQREAIADAVLINEGSEDDLLRQVENLYEDRLFPARLGM